MHDLNRPLAIEGLLDDDLPLFLSLAASDSLTSLVTPHERPVRQRQRAFAMRTGMSARARYVLWLCWTNEFDTAERRVTGS